MRYSVPAAPPVTGPEPAAPAGGEGAREAAASAVAGYLSHVMAMVGSEMRKLRHEPSALLLRAVQPVLWLVVFGNVLARVRGLDTGGLDYVAFLAPGVLAQSVLFIAIFYGIAAIWERDLGIVDKYLASPAARSALVIGKAISGAVRGLSQVVVVYAVAAVMGVGLQWRPDRVLGVLFFVALGSACFATFSLVIATLVRTRERFMGIGQLITMPFFFASSAVYPLSLMPGWLRAIARVNPLTYLVDALRGLMVVGGTSVLGLWVDLAVLTGTTAVMVVLASRLFHRLGE
jgi:ABC-2 type transport system permease protein